MHAAAAVVAIGVAGAGGIWGGVSRVAGVGCRYRGLVCGQEGGCRGGGHGALVGW